MPSLVAWLRLAIPARYSDRNQLSVKGKKRAGIVATWYLSRNVKLSLNYHQTDFKLGAAANGNRPTVQIVIALQLAY